MIEKNCAYCGGPIMPVSDYTRHKKYCSVECREKARAEVAETRKDEKAIIDRAIARAARQKGLEECVKEASRQGISYGRYMARKESFD